MVSSLQSERLALKIIKTKRDHYQLDITYIAFCGGKGNCIPVGTLMEISDLLLMYRTRGTLLLLDPFIFKQIIGHFYWHSLKYHSISNTSGLFIHYFFNLFGPQKLICYCTDQEFSRKRKITLACILKFTDELFWLLILSINTLFKSFTGTPSIKDRRSSTIN